MKKFTLFVQAPVLRFMAEIKKEAGTEIFPASFFWVLFLHLSVNQPTDVQKVNTQQNSTFPAVEFFAASCKHGYK